MNEVKRTRELDLDSNEVERTRELDLDLSQYNSLFTGHRVRQPTDKQYRFVSAYLGGRSVVESFYTAGFAYTGKARQQWNQANKKLQSKGVQRLLGLVIRKFVEDKRTTVSALIDKALVSYDRADTVREQLDCLKLIARLKGYI